MGRRAEREEPVNEARVRLYAELMEAQERIAHARGVDDQTALAAMDEAEAAPSEADRREDLLWSALAAYVEALGGRLELRAVFGEEAIVVRRSRG